MSTRYIGLFMGNSIGDRRALIVRHVGCPKYVNCTQKEMNYRLCLKSITARIAEQT